MKQQLMLVAMLSVGTALTTMGSIKPVAASLTPPATYNYSYTWNATDSEQYLNVNGVDSIPLYTRTADGVYFNYTSTYNVLDDLLVTQSFKRSNTTWQVSGTSYKPDENKIGSNNTVGTINDKLYIEFNNQTNKDYLLFIDISSTNNALNNSGYEIRYDDVYLIESSTTLIMFSFGFYLNLYLPAYTNIKYNTTSISQERYFDAWYLRDMGISESYQQGLDAETDGILTDYLGTDAQQIGWVLIGIAAILFAFKGGK